MITQFHTDSPEALDAIAAPDPKQIWIHGSITYVYTGDDMQPVIVEQ